ncbi:unnamed protein product [Knipowitschia caucasica]|uniref:Uncharacterized protein n=1 Tax=Knipowitschia caucasica TaxID=637954 RepID=A0AAV2KLR5_KNICA
MASPRRTEAGILCRVKTLVTFWSGTGHACFCPELHSQLHPQCASEVHGTEDSYVLQLGVHTETEAKSHVY